ncbi:hypothetical protein GV794_24025 [Nocardia cyriacigeorgica]|uniref:Sporadically distributed protein, TIGR04141 family n=1 Tax=Nocardia cyriacigeorgica TaxID=135487 RepID=A0ABX0CQB6_9NOCA|nr:hypothetical protein [Nocardia cyriacigeorgica]
MLITGGVPKERADWCQSVQQITRLDVNERSYSAAGLMLLRTSSSLYGLSYGVGQHILDPYYRDDDFGLEFATRCLDEDGIVKVRNQIMDGRGRVDEYSISRGDNITGFGVDRFSAVVRRICGTASTLSLSSSARRSTKAIRIECSESTLKLPLATTPEEFVADLRKIEEVCARPDPLPQLQFVDRLRALDPRSRRAVEAHRQLEKMLANPTHPRMTIGVPEACQEGFGSAQLFRVERGRLTNETTDIDLTLLLSEIPKIPEGGRIEALNRARVYMYSDDEGITPASVATKGSEWLIADVNVGAERFFYGNGKWYSIGGNFLEILREELTEIFQDSPSIPLPAWPKGAIVEGRDSHDEGWYNNEAAQHPDLTHFDKATIVTKHFNGGGLEICDLLGPDGELVCVKKASNTAALNHLFAQAVAAVETLRSDGEIRKKFLDQLRIKSPTHRLLTDFGSLRVVFAILLKDGEDVNVDSLFAFAQVSLVHSVRTLRAMNADVSVITISR